MALHPYTGKPRNVVRLAGFARKEMRRYHDGRKPIWITELSWPAAKGKTKNTTGFETTDRGQAPRLREGLRLLATRPQAAADRAGVLVHVALARGLAELVRLLRPAPRARRPDRLGPGAGGVPHGARRLQGCAKASGDATRCR